MADKCKFLGESIGKHTLIKCNTCQGNVRLKYFVHRCAVHGICVPEYAGNSQDAPGFKLCYACMEKRTK